MEINDKNIVLTGASAGIGLEILRQLLQYKNVKIVAVARNIETIPVQEGIVFPFSADISSKEGVDSLFSYCKSVFANIDIFISNAGFAYFEKLNFPDWKHIEEIYSLNVFSILYSLERFKADSTGNPKYFVCTSSAVAMVPLPYYSLYCSTKSALHQFFNTYRYEKSKDLHTMVVYPVATRTAFFDKAANSSDMSLPFLTQTPDVVAKAVICGIEKNKKKVYPSFLFRIFNIAGRIFPFLFHLYSSNEKRKALKNQGL
ncbi:MAG: SDR family NAD(P)-dependent oxidoreductase [Dysgonomonas sp.]|nr:SDR family NAD(P)-dependent oxidoreductase [Dysgonomonas sp.]